MIHRPVNNDSVLGAITNAIVARFKPERIVLFGSHARGDARKHSDYDLMVEIAGLENDREVWDARSQIRATLPRGVEVDITVRTPSDFQERRDDPGTLDWAIAREGVVIYPADGDSQSLRPPARVRESRDLPASIQEWLEAANNDAVMVDQLSTQNFVVWPGVCFHAQQAVEKYLKALLVHYHIHPPRTHDLTELLAEIRKAGSTLPGLDADCALLSEFPIDPRYPSKKGKPDAETGIAAVHAMRRVVTAAKAAMRLEE